MTTRLDSVLKRALTIDGSEFVLTLTGAGFKLAAKGMRRGFELQWAQIVNGEAALAVALHASLGAFPAVAKSATPKKTKAKPLGRGRRL